MKVCTIEGCEKPETRKAQGWCDMHYARWRRHGDVNWRRPTLHDRFDKFVDRSGDCHRWTGAHDRKGYGRFVYKGSSIGAHKVALILAGITVPSNMQVDHVWARGCQYRDCVRVDHLEVVTPRVNTLRGGSVSALNARKTHCKRGHEFTPENTRTYPSSKGRHCRQCQEIAHERKRRLRQEAKLTAQRSVLSQLTQWKEAS